MANALRWPRDRLLRPRPSLIRLTSTAYLDLLEAPGAVTRFDARDAIADAERARRWLRRAL
jgi:hypothetical protein